MPLRDLAFRHSFKTVDGRELDYNLDQLRAFFPTYDVKDYGAIGDGVANDTAAIQAAVDAVGTAGGVVFFPPGQYLIHSAITIPRSLVWFEGSGTDISIITTMTAAQNGLHFSNGGNGGVRDIQINAGVAKTAGAGILFDTWGSAFIDRVNIGAQFVGISLLTANIVRISNSLIQFIIENTGIGIYIDGGIEQYITQTFIRGIDGTHQSLAAIKIVDSGAYYMDFVSAIATGDGLLLAPPLNKEAAGGFLVSNVWDSMDGNALHIAPATGGRVKYLHTEGESYSSGFSHGVYFEGPGDIEAIDISNATIVNNYLHGVALSVGTDISISDSIISGNSVTSSGTYSGIQVAAGVSNFKFVGNKSGKTATIPANSQKYGIEVVSGASNNYIIACNDLTTNATAGLLDAGTGTSKQVVGNIPHEVDVLALTNLVFPATQVASSGANTLDDYEEGTWTPVLTFSTPGDVSVTYSTQQGAYTKIGRMVTVQFNVITSAFTHTTAAGSVLITGLPFTSLNVTNGNFFGAVNWQGITNATFTDMTSNIGANSTNIGINGSGSGVAQSAIVVTDMPTGGNVRLRGIATYFST